MKRKVLLAVLSVFSAVCCGLAVSACTNADDADGSPDNGVVSGVGNGDSQGGNQGGNGGNSGNQGGNGSNSGNQGGEDEISGTGYKVTVYGADGNLFKGAEVEINGREAQTGDDGVVEFADMAHAKYDISVYAEGYTVTKPQTTGSNGEYEVYLSKVAEDNVFSLSTFGSVRYAVSIGWEADSEMPNMINPENVVYTLKNTGDTPATFTIKLFDAIAYSAYENAPRHSVGTFNSAGPADAGYTPVSVVLEKNETYAFILTADYNAFESQNKECYPVVYDVEIISEQAPVKGATKTYMLDALPDGNTQHTVAANTPVYFKFDSTAAAYKGADFMLSFNENDLTIEDFGISSYAVTGSTVSDGQAIAGNDYYARVLVVKSVSGNVSFTSTPQIPEGTANNPLRLTSSDVGKVYSGSTVNNDRDRQKWYAVTNETREAKKYTIVPDETAGALMVAYVYKENGSAVSYSVEGKSLWFEVPAGATYLVAVGNTSNAGGYSFTFRDYNPATDIGGDSYGNPITYIVKEGEQSYNVTMNAGEDGGKFFTFETAEAGYYTVTVECADENASTVIADRFVVADKSDSINNHLISLNNTLCTEKFSVCIRMTRYSKEIDTVWTVKINFVPLVAVDNTVTVNGDAATVGGLTVNVKKDGKVVATGVTGSDGVAHVSFIPGVYDIEIVGFDADTYGYNPVQTTFVAGGGSFTVNLAKMGSYTFTVQNPDGSVVSGATVTLKNGEGVVCYGTTDADGKYTTDVVVLGEYSVEYTSTSKTGNYLKSCTTDSEETNVTLVLTAPAEVTHANDTSVPELYEGRTIIKNSAIRTGRYNYQFTAETAGTYTITMDTDKNLAATDGISNVYLTVDGTTVSDAIVSGGTIDAGLNANNILTADEATKGTNVYRTITVTLKEGQTIGLSLYIYSYSAVKGVIDIVKN